MTERLELPATAWAVLGVLSFDDELSGYDIKRWAEQSIAFFYWAPSYSQVYSELRRLEAADLVASRIEQTSAARSRRLYAITEAGRTQMRLWADAIELEPVVLKHPLILRVWAAHNGDRQRLLAVLDEHRDEAHRRGERASQHSANASRVHAWRFASLADEWSARYWREEAERIGWLRERLQAEVEQGQS